MTAKIVIFCCCFLERQLYFKSYAVLIESSKILYKIVCKKRMVENEPFM